MVVVVGDTAAEGVPNPPGGLLQVYDVAPDAVNGVEAPKQMAGELAEAVIVGMGLTVTTAVVEAVQPLVTVTV